MQTPIQQTPLSSPDIFQYNSEAMHKFEKQMARFFGREYQRWQGNKTAPEAYGVSSFEGNIATEVTRKKAIGECYDDEHGYAIYRAFLDRDYMAYTTGYYGADAEEAMASTVSLEKSQEQKYDLIIERAQIEDGHHVLDLGCGFGGLSKYLLNKFPNLTITGINPSEVQTGHIKRLIRYHDRNFEGERFRLIQKYIDDIDIGSDELPLNSVDRIVSIGFIEHVTNLDLLFQKLAPILRPGGKCLHHCIVSIDTIPRLLAADDTRIGDYFPGGHIWPFDELPRHNTHLRFAERWFLNGMNYWRTLDEWHKRFWRSVDELYPNSIQNAEQLQYWASYFSLCKAMFIPNEGKSYGNGHFLFEKPR